MVQRVDVTVPRILATILKSMILAGMVVRFCCPAQQAAAWMEVAMNRTALDDGISFPERTA
jgi:hypothetical protein